MYLVKETGCKFKETITSLCVLVCNAFFLFYFNIRGKDFFPRRNGSARQICRPKEIKQSAGYSLYVPRYWNCVSILGYLKL